MHGRRFLLRRVPRTLGANIERKKKTGIKEKRKVSTLDAAFWAIKSISSNLDRAIPEQEMPASKLLEGGKQLLCLHTEHKLKIWFNKMPLFSAGGRCLISSFRLLFTNSINRFFFSSQCVTRCGVPRILCTWLIQQPILYNTDTSDRSGGSAAWFLQHILC